MKWYKISIISFLILSIVSCQSPVSTKVYADVDEMAADVKTTVKTISQADFKKVLDSSKPYNLLDCREKEYFDTACIPGAVNVARGVLEFEVGNKIQDRRKTLYVYSNNEAKSVLAANSLKLIKYSKVIVIESNWDAWKSAYSDNIQLEPNAGEVKTAAPVVEESGCGG